VHFSGIEPSARRVRWIFPGALPSFDYSLLVPAAPRSALEDTDRAGRRIGLVDGTPRPLALRRIVKQAELIGVELPESAFDLLRDLKVDALAFPRESVIAFCRSRLPGARVLAKGYGVNRVGSAVAEGQYWIAIPICPTLREANDGLVATHHRAWKLGRLRRCNGVNARFLLLRRDRLQHRQPGLCCSATTRLRSSSGVMAVRIAAGAPQSLFHVRIGDDLACPALTLEMIAPACRPAPRR